VQPDGDAAKRGRGVERWTVRLRKRAGTRPAVDPDTLLAAVRALDGVTDAALGRDAAGHQALRLTLADGVDDATVARRVAELLDGRFGVPVDARRARLVEYAGPDRREPEAAATPPAARAAAPRSTGRYGRPRSLLFERMTVVTSQDEVGAEVVLMTSAGRSAGRASGPAENGAALDTVARAALSAVDGVLAGVGTCAVEETHVAVVAGRRVVVVVVDLVTPETTERLTGSAAVEEDPRQAVVRACLAALDRRVEGLLGARRSTLGA
jgi:hypothetical protein